MCQSKTTKDKAAEPKPQEPEVVVPELTVEQQLEAQQDKYLRLAAEFENAKKRMEREKSDHAKWATERVILALLSIIDTFDAALGSMKDHDQKDPLLMGVQMINKQLHELLTREGAERLVTVGKVFNPEHHEAIQQIETDEHDENEVLAEIQSGYLMHGRLIRPAMVKIAVPVQSDSATETESQ
jgi:molecular chaperone GrpE